MIPGSFDYHAPKTIAEAVALLGRYRDDAKVLSGGQSLLPLPSLSTIVRDYWFDAAGPRSTMWRTKSAVRFGSSAAPNTAQASRPAAARPM